jgi:hypothetical protein
MQKILMMQLEPATAHNQIPKEPKGKGPTMQKILMMQPYC